MNVLEMSTSVHCAAPACEDIHICTRCSQRQEEEVLAGSECVAGRVSHRLALTTHINFQVYYRSRYRTSTGIIRIIRVHTKPATAFMEYLQHDQKVVIVADLRQPH